MTGLNYLKNGQDPVAMKDEEYPEWLWSCLDVVKSNKDDADADAGDEFCKSFLCHFTSSMQLELIADPNLAKSKKQRTLAARRQKALEAKLLAEGNLEALAPKVPVQHQSINLPGAENNSVEHNIEAAAKREELKKAMRKERKAKIKESNYLKSM